MPILTKRSLDWNTIDEKDEKLEKVDIIIGSEITYEEEHGILLLKVLKGLLKKGGFFYEILESTRPVYLSIVAQLIQ